MSEHYELARCRICGNDKLYKFLDLGVQPLANAFLTAEEIEHEKFFPLRVAFCPDCCLVQLLDNVSSEFLFKDYAYFTSASAPMKEHFRALAEGLSKKYKLTKENFVVDIGGGDGTLLSYFDCKRLNVEPALNVAQKSWKKGIATWSGFFGANTAYKIVQPFGKADLIIATNVLAHIDNLYDFMAGIKCLLSEWGVFVVEVPYWLDQFKNNDYTQFYHEHRSYFLIRPLQALAKEFGLWVNRVEKIPVHGGSIRVYFGKKCAVEPNVYRLENKEMNFWLKDTYAKFGQTVAKNKEKLLNILQKLKQQNKKIVGYGAPAKGTVLLTYCGIGPLWLDYVTDTTPYKQGKFTPCLHIPIVSPDELHKNPPDYALLLAWNFRREIFIKEKEFLLNGGKFIDPIPFPRVVP